MPSSVNPIIPRYINLVADSQLKTNAIIDSLISGIKKDNSVVESILGRKALFSANVCSEASKQIETGINVAKVAMATLTEIQKQVEELKLSITSLNLADDTAISIAETNYNFQMNRIYTVLTNADFGSKKLFDGSVAMTSGAKLPYMSLPNNVAPWKILDSSDPQSTTTLSIPRLLAGDGTIENVPVKGTFESLFPVTNNTITALTALNNVAATAAGAGLAFADQRTLISNAIPLGVNAEQDLMNGIVINAYNAAETSITIGAVPNGADSNNNALLALNIAKAAGTNVTLSSNNINEVILATAKIVNTLTTARDGGAVNAAAALAVVNTIAHDNTVSYSQRALLNLTYTIASIDPTPGTDDPGNAYLRLDNAINAVRQYATESRNRSFPNPIYIGSVKTAGDRRQALEIMNSISDKLTSVISNIQSFESGMERASVIVGALEIQLRDASASSLNTDYPSSLSKLAEIVRKTKVSNIAYVVSENELNRLVEYLERGAN